MTCSLLVFSQNDMQSAGCVRYKSGAVSAEWGAQGMSKIGGMRSIGETMVQETEI